MTARIVVKKKVQSWVAAHGVIALAAVVKNAEPLFQIRLRKTATPRLIETQ